MYMHHSVTLKFVPCIYIVKEIDFCLENLREKLCTIKKVSSKKGGEK